MKKDVKEFNHEEILRQIIIGIVSSAEGIVKGAFNISKDEKIFYLKIEDVKKLDEKGFAMLGICLSVLTSLLEEHEDYIRSANPISYHNYVILKDMSDFMKKIRDNGNEESDAANEES